MSFELTPKQQEAQKILASDSQYLCLAGGSRSGKTALIVRNIIFRALKAPGSRHAMFRFRFNAMKNSIVADTFPKIMRLAFPGVDYKLNKTDLYVEFTNGSQIWFAGLDDSTRVEKILGMEFSTIYFNESSQIPYSSVQVAITRLAQLSVQVVDGAKNKELKPRLYFDLNPTKKSHWTYILFNKKLDPATKKPLPNPDNYATFQINPKDNAQNLTSGYIETLESMSSVMRKRFLYGEYSDDDPNALFKDTIIDQNRLIDASKMPHLIRLVVAVDPSGADDNTDNADAIGIVAAGIGTDGKAYLLQDCTVTAGPAVWGRVATDLYDRLDADVIVAEGNYGGAMVGHVIKTARPNTPFKMVTATRGKHVRAEPFSALYEQGKVVHVGYFPELEEELCAFSTSGYLGTSSPNRADALVWCLAELFNGIVNPRKENKPIAQRFVPSDRGAGY